MHKKSLFIAVLVFAFLGLIVLPQEWASATIPPPASCDVTLTSGQNIQAVVDLGGPKTICLQGTFKQSVIIGPEDTAAGYITIQGVSPGGIMNGQNGIGASDPGTSYSAGMDAFELLPGVHNVTIRDLEIKDYKDPTAGTGTGNAVQAWGPYVPGAATSNVNIWNNNMHGFSWNGILVGNSGGTGLHSNWSVIGNTVEPCWIGIELTNTSNSVIEDNTVSGGGCFPTDYPPLGYVIGIMLQARNIAVEGGSGSLTMSNVSVQGNTIIALGPATYEYGIYLLAWANGGPTATLSNIKVGGSGNRLENNAIHGIVLNGLEQGTVDGVSIVDNNILNNNTGIRVMGTSTNVTAHFNNISSNITWGARNTAAAELDAELNWWGSSSGPTHSGNPGGTGDAVTNNVDYDPWLQIYWKDYNGQAPGGYMPDIDQKQNFNNVIRTEENGNGVNCQGGWLPYPDSHASGGRITYSDTATVSCTFTFTGTSITYIGTPSNNKGIARVWIDGNDMGDVDLYSPTLKYQQKLYTNMGLSPGQHTITIVVTGRKNPSSSLHRIDVDAFDVANNPHYCAPVAEANSLWWLDKAHDVGIFEFPEVGEGYCGGDINHDGKADILDLVQELAIMMNTNQGHTGTTIEDEQDGIETFLAYYGFNDKLYEHTEYPAQYPDWLPYFMYIEEEVERSQDVKLDLGFWHVDQVQGGPGDWLVWWSRRGGHAVTVAGVDSQNFLLAISDPDNDAAESGGFGVVRPVPGGHMLHPNDPSVHNNEANASHDIYTVGPSPSPGGKMGLLNFPSKWNFPTGEWEYVGPVPSTWQEPLYESMTFTEIEAAVIVSPIICGNSHIDPGETCDPPGGQQPPNGNPCDADCTFCGDGNTDPDEACDDANNNNNDNCKNNCTLASCGDGVVGPGETCDPPGSTPLLPPGNQNQCRQTCKYCGDGQVNNGEQCDDGNANNNDNCDNICILNPDLVITSLTAPASAGTGTNISIGDTTKNNGPGAALASTTKFYLSIDNILNGGDTVLGSRAVPALALNANSLGNTSVTISTSIPSGNYFIIAKADDLNAIVEANENNNTNSKAIKVLAVTVVKPNGGETIPSGGISNIQWLASSDAVKFDLQYSMNNGTSWVTIASKVTGTNYNWTVPKPPKNKPNCLVKVIGYNASNVKLDEDTSDAPFKIEVVKVTSPNGGENWKSGTDHDIKWTTNGTKKTVKKVKLYYTYNGGTNWILIYTILTGNSGTYNWRVPSANSANCKVKVVLKDKLGTTIGTDMSDALFTISP